MPKHTKNLAPELIFELIEQLQIEAPKTLAGFDPDVLCKYIKEIPGVLQAQQPELTRIGAIEIDVYVDNGNGITMRRFTFDHDVPQTVSLVHDNGHQDQHQGATQ